MSVSSPGVGRGGRFTGWISVSAATWEPLTRQPNDGKYAPTWCFICYFLFSLI
jgi:hypothetical protein